MHELSLCRAIAETANEYSQGRPVSRVNLRIGFLRQVVPQTLEHCWSIATRGSGLSESELIVTYVQPTVLCNECDTETTLEDPVLSCGSCLSRSVDLVTGDEFLIESIDVETGATPLASNRAL